MLNFFKNIFATKPEQSPAAERNGRVPGLPGGVPNRTLTPPVGASPRPQMPARKNLTTHPAPSQVTNLPSSQPTNKVIQLSLQSVLSSLPMELKGRVKQIDVGAAEISIPLDTVLSQLSSGSVKIAFGQMRRAAPQLFSNQNDLDETPVALPLNEILSQLNPGLLFRRQDQKHIEVPEEIRSPFSDNGAGLVFSVGPGKAPVAPPQREVAPPSQAAAPIQPHIQQTLPPRNV
jgi:hypothetical protein